MDNDSCLLPVSFGQRRIWLVEQFLPFGGAYLIPCRVPIDGPVDVTVLEAALAVVVNRHQTLRTSFRTVDGGPMQVVAAGRVPVWREDVRDRPDPAAAVDECVAAMAREPFDLEVGPLLRARLLQVAADRFELVVVTHHLVADAASGDLLFARVGCGV